MALTLFAPAVASGQKVLGLRTGLNVTTLGLERGELSPDHIEGLNIGIALYWPWSDNLGATVAAAYSQKGAEWNDRGWTIDLDYNELTTLLTLGVPVERSIAARVFLGSALSFLVHDAINCSSSCVIESEFKEFDVGVVGGAGLCYDATDTLIFSLDVLYNHGLKKLRQRDTRNRAVAIQFGMGVPFIVGRRSRESSVP
jgi:hypothetical protein